MSIEEITRMAQEASILGSFDMLQGNQWRQDTIRGLERFAFLVAAAERNAILQMSRDQWFKTQSHFEDAIRTRGQT